MSRLDFELDIPFAENTGRRCVPACTRMIAGYLLPELCIDSKRAEELSGFRDDRATWATQHLLSLNDMGVEVGWIQDEDIAEFANRPEGYIRRQIPDELAYQAFVQSNDLPQEAVRIHEYFSRGLTFEKRQATVDDIRHRMIGGYVVRLEVNGKVLAGQPGFVNHAVVVSGFGDGVVRIENPDGLHGSKPRQIIGWDVLEKAWPEERALQYYRCKMVL